MTAKKYLSLERLTEYDGLIKDKINEGDEGVKSYVDAEVAKMASSSHTHDDVYYTETEIDDKLSAINTSISNITSGTASVKNAEHAVNADTAASATKATQDGDGKVISSTYETKNDANAKLTEAKSYADDAANKVKNDLLNGAGEAYDTLKELGDLITENVDAIEALETVATNKADKEHTHSWDILEDRPFYENISGDILLEKQIVNCSESTGNGYSVYINASLTVTRGNEYTVIWDGIPYKVIAETNSLGNIYWNGSSTNTGEPFFIGGSGSKLYIATENQEEHTLEVYSNYNYELKQLDEKYIPDNIQRSTDDNLTTTDKTVVGAINELNNNLANTSNGGVGKSTTGTVYTIDNESVTAAEGAEIFNDYTNNKAVGKYSHAEGSTTIATGETSHAEGQNTTASGIHSHAEGLLTEAIKAGSHAEGISSKASGDYSHAEGFYTESNGKGSHAEGGNLDRGGSTATSTYTVSSKDYSEITTPITVNGSIAQGIHSHVEGAQSLAYGYASHAEGEKSKAFNAASHAEGADTKSSGYASHAEGNTTEATGMGSHAEGMNSKATGDMSHAEGNGAQASGAMSHAEGLQAIASGYASHAEGTNTKSSGYASHTEGTSTVASGDNSHAEGNLTTASGYMSHAEGNSMNKLPSSITSTTSDTNIISTWNSTKFTLAKGQSSHAEGENVLALNMASHAEGQMTIASGAMSHAEGSQTKASSMASHAEGNMTEASGYMSHAEGNLSIASGAMSHAEGYGTIAKGNFQHVEGQYNIEDSTNKYAHIVGNGSGNARSNAHTVDWDGNAWYQGNVYVGGTSQDDASQLATTAFVEEKVAALVNSAPETLDTLNELATAIQDHQSVTDALDTAISNKQDKSDENLTTTDKTIVGAINELNTSISDKANTTHTHAISDITDLETTLSNTASAIAANTDSITAHSTAINNLQTAIEEIEEVTSAEIQALFSGTGLEIPPGEGDDIPDPVED